jgi:hypothetical protein
MDFLFLRSPRAIYSFIKQTNLSAIRIANNQEAEKQKYLTDRKFRSQHLLGVESAVLVFLKITAGSRKTTTAISPPA